MSSDIHIPAPGIPGHLQAHMFKLRQPHICINKKYILGGFPDQLEADCHGTLALCLPFPRVTQAQCVSGSGSPPTGPGLAASSPCVGQAQLNPAWHSEECSEAEQLPPACRGLVLPCPEQNELAQNPSIHGLS